MMKMSYHPGKLRESVAPSNCPLLGDIAGAISPTLMASQRSGVIRVNRDIFQRLLLMVPSKRTRAIKLMRVSSVFEDRDHF
jgi:hypothetical protein